MPGPSALTITEFHCIQMYGSIFNIAVSNQFLDCVPHNEMSSRFFLAVFMQCSAVFFSVTVNCDKKMGI